MSDQKNTRPLHVIADDISKNWAKVNFAAKPYLAAMRQMSSMEDTYGYEDASGVILYFLSNAGSWRGPEAKRIKAELKAML